MAVLDVEKAINDVIGNDGLILTRFFKTCSTRDIFCVVKDVSIDGFYIFYDEDTTICHKFMGDSDRFSRFIELVYDMKFHISTSKNWDKNMVTYDHIQAKDQAIDYIRYGCRMIERMT